MGGFGAMAPVWVRRAQHRIKYTALAIMAVSIASIATSEAQEPDGAPHDGFHAGLSATPAVPGKGLGVGADRQSNSSEEGGGELGPWFLPHFYPSTPAEVLETMFRTALAALEEGRPEEAQRLLERVIAEAPGSAIAAKARPYLARLYSRGGIGELSEAEASLAADAGGTSGSFSSRSSRKRPSQVKGAPPEERAAPRTFDPHAILARSGRNVSPQLEEQFLLAAGDRVFFGAGSAELGTRARAVLEAQAKFMAVRRELAAMIEGHADDGKTSAEEEIKLSYARAAVVRDGLVAAGISPDRLVVVARGREAPASACPDPACAAQNRRVITVLMSTAALETIRSARAAAGASPHAQIVPETQ